MTNLLKETLEFMKANGKAPADVRWVGTLDPDYLQAIRPTPQPVPCGAWEDFARFADFNYDAGYGGAEVNGALVIVGDDWWLERGEYDGSEWWEFKTIPKKPHDPTPLRDIDLKDD